MSPKNKQNTKHHSKTFLSKIASNIGPSLPLSLLHQLEEDHVQHCNLHANNLTTLDIDGCDVMNEDGYFRMPFATTADYHERDRHCNHGDDGIHGHDDSNANNNYSTKAGCMLNDLIELDISSNRLGHGYSKKNGSYKDRADASDTYFDKNEHDGCEEEKHNINDDYRRDCTRKKRASLLSFCPNLRILNVSSNDLTTEILTSLFSLSLSSPSTSISSPPSSPPPPPPVSPPPPPPPSMQVQLNQLMELNLSHNGLSCIPNKLHQVCPNLQKLNVEGNFLSSTKHFLQSIYPLKESLTTLIVNEQKYDDFDEESLKSTNNEESGTTNSMCLEDTWRPRTICILSNLASLDCVDVTVEEREEARFALEIGWMNSNGDGNVERTKKVNVGEGRRHSNDDYCGRTEEESITKKDGVKKSNQHQKSFASRQRKDDISGFKDGKESIEAMQMSRMAKLATGQSQKSARATAHIRKEQHSSQNNRPRKAAPSLSFNEHQLGKATDVVAEKFEKALSGINQRQRKLDRGGYNAPPSHSSARNGVDKIVGAHCNNRSREGRKRIDEKKNISDQGQMSCDESQSTTVASTLSQVKLNKLENRVKLLSELAGEQAEVTERLLLLSGTAINAQKDEKNSKQQVSMVSDVSTQANLITSEVNYRGENENNHSINKSAVKNTKCLTLLERKSMGQKNKTVLVNKDEQFQQRTKAVVWVLFAFIKQQYCTFLKMAFHRWKFHNIILRYEEQLESEISASKQRINSAVDEAVQRTTTKLDKEHQHRIEEVQRALNSARHVNVTLEHEGEKLKKELRRAEEYQVKIKREFEQDMMLLGKASQQEAQRLVSAVQREEEYRFRAEKDRLEKEMKKMEKHYSKNLDLLKKEKDIACKEAHSARKALDSEREERESIEMHWKQNARKQETALQTMKNEAFEMNEQERQQAEKKMQENMAQFKQAFEMAAKRAASDRAKCEQALCDSKEYVKTIKMQKMTIGELEKKVLMGEQKAQKMEGIICSIHSTNAEIKQQLIDLTEKYTKCSIALGMKDVQVESLEKEREVTRHVLKEKDEKLHQLKRNLEGRKKEKDEAARECLIQREKVGVMEQRIKSLQETADQAAKAAIQEKNDTMKEKIHLLEMENKKLSGEVRDSKQTINAKNEAQQKQVNNLKKEVLSLNKALDLREESIKRSKKQTLLVQAAFEANELEIIQRHQRENEQMKLSIQRELSIQKEKLLEVERGRDEARQLCVNLEADAKALAQELFAEQNKRIQTEDQVKSLSEALDGQRIMMQNAIKGICKNSSKSILGQGKF